MHTIAMSRALVPVAMTLVCAVAPFSMTAHEPMHETSGLVMCVGFSDGTGLDIGIPDGMTLSVNEHEFILSDETETYSYTLTDIASFSYREIPVFDTEAGTADAVAGPSIYFSGNTLKAVCAGAGHSCVVSSLSGILVSEVVFDECLTLDISSFAPGVYIVSINGVKPLKINVR